MSVNVETIQASTANSLLPPVPKGLVLLTVPPLAQKPTPAQIAELAAASKQNGWAYGIEEAAAALAVFRFAKPKSDTKPALLILKNEEAVLDAREMGIAAISIPADCKNSVPFIQKVVTELRNDNLSCLVYLGTGQTENIKQACGNAGLPFVALHPLKFFSPLPDKPTIGNLLDRMNPSEFIQKAENLLSDAALGKFSEEPPLSLEDAAEEARKILLSHEMTELQKNFELRKIRLRLDMTLYEWKETILNPLRDEVRSEHLKLELLALLQTDDRVEFVTQKGKLCSKYQMSSHLLDQAIAAIKQRTSTAEAEVMDLETFFNKPSTGLEWVIPELLPVGETALLIASPKTGKSLLAIDAAFAVATGESDFLGIPVKQGRVLFISVDESPSSTRQKLFNRGFRPDDKNFHLMTSFDVSQIAKLEAELEAFRPTLVVVDSLKRITHGVGISENSAEFGEIIYELKELFTRYGASAILIHHSNKNADALGVNRPRGTTAIPAAAWGVWDLQHILKPSPSDKKKFVIDPRDPKRMLTIESRGAEAKKITVELEGEHNSWVTVNEDGGKEQAERQKWQNRISGILTKNPKGLTSKEIIELMGVGKEDWQTVYSTLNRMSNKQLIDEKPAPGKSRSRLYSLPKLSQPPESDTANNTSQNPFTPPPPTQNYSFVNPNSESIDISEFEVTKPVTKPPLNHDSTNFSKTTCVEFSNPVVEGDSGVTKPIDTNRGGEGKNDVVELNQSTAQLSQPPSETRENEAVDCGADTSFSEAEVKACVAELKLAVEEDDPRVGNAVLIEFATLPEQLRMRVLSKLSSRTKAAIRQMQRQAEAKVGDKCQVLQLKESGDAWADVKQVWVDAVLFSFPGGGQRCWGFEVDGKNIGIHGRDEWRLVDEVQNE
ncbi:MULTISPECIES: AAA family ATPase [Cyanophyceae]|uniref:AAA family ATPase n=1 Tax=Cyanophyceae TaxID=3028117 RepID=UPI0016831049|nr:AAA family ATPase [Trichocoleus sp. FACHB-69]MBD1933308.1 AAA family ATPase [Trichocoleus sp. FACHB-69]